MFIYNLLNSFRQIKRNLSFSLINILGLSLGLSLVIVLLTWLQFELSYDNFHQNAKRIFRVVVEFEREKSSDNYANTPAPLGDALKKEIPEVAEYVRFGQLTRMLVNYENEQHYEDIDLADPSVFKVFSFKLLSGNQETALNNPASLIISETNAKKYFGNKNPLGATMLLGDNKKPFTVTGIMKDVPDNSQISFNFLSSFSEEKTDNSWGIWNYQTYILAKNEDSFRSINEKLPEVVKTIPGDDKFKLHIQPLTSIHLHSRLRSDIETNLDIKTVYVISSILILVLIVACINYMNLATARYSKRGKETGLKKVAGASNSDLANQFLFESFAITFCSFLIALFLSYLLIPLFSSITGVTLNFKSLLSLNSIPVFIILIVTTTFFAGSYPAILLSSVNPVSTIRDDIKLAGMISVKVFRKGLVIFQFLISIFLITSAFLIRSQLIYIMNKNLGLTADQVIVVPIYQANVKPKYELFKKEILNIPFVLNASAVAYYPGKQGFNQSTWWEGLPEGDFSNAIDWIPVDQDFISTLKIGLIQGSFFPSDISSKDEKVYVLNEAAVKRIGWKDPIGKQFEIVERGSVIGVVKDFNFKSLHDELAPVALAFYPKAFDNLMIKVSAENISKTIGLLKKKWAELFPGYPFEFTFLNDDFQKMYIRETRTASLITYVSIMALLVSAVGLFGLVLFTIDNRIKEIGIRKVAGSTTGRIVMMLNMEFIRWILISFLLSFPVVIYSMHKWLKNFAYRVSLNWWIFASAGLITIFISLLTVSWHTWSTAAKNPVECLRHE